MIPSRLILDVLGATWAPSAPTDPRYAFGAGERELMWHADGELVAFTTSSLEWEGPSAVWVKAEPLRAALSARGLAIWARSLGEKIPWIDEQDASPDRTEIYSAHQLAPGPAETWRSTTKQNLNSGLPRSRGHHETADDATASTDGISNDDSS